MSEIRRRKIYAGYYDRYDRKPFYVVCEATDYDTGEVNIIMQEYSLTRTMPFVTISRDSFCEIVTLPDGRKVDKFTPTPISRLAIVISTDSNKKVCAVPPAAM